jgi:hypothetical protein
LAPFISTINILTEEKGDVNRKFDKILASMALSFCEHKVHKTEYWVDYPRRENGKSQTAGSHGSIREWLGK